MAAVLPFASLSHSDLTMPLTTNALPSSAMKKRPLSPLRSHDDVRNVVVAGRTTSEPSMTEPAVAFDPRQIKLLKVIGRGTFAHQVALARHDKTQCMCVVKTMDKRKLLQRKQVVHTLTEKRVLEKLHGHPFIVKLYASFQTDYELHFVLEYCQGGELFFHLQQQRSQKFDEPTTRFYAAEVLAALKELHTREIVYRDLKPENILLDAHGHVKLADFGFAKQNMNTGQRTFSFCGSPEYLSPEMVSKTGHGLETDMWSFGCFIYELLTGSPPFQCEDMHRLFRLIQQGRVWYPPYLSGYVISLLKGLLCVNPASRLTVAQAMNHPFFTLALNWDEVLQRKILPPMVPMCHGRDCTDNFDDDYTNAPVSLLKLRSLDLHKRLSRGDCAGYGDLFDDF
ncbi:uncharacterized protein CCR75_005995 [Bremia lactucae]|uniref:AGC protein kinase n=1 Tax=Bremia lactucae TaxID=4779 RepID=A0A976FQP2_BRELC|nr:hypothetical protein CCR75_005995 [Bremia lactucae]